MSLSDPFQAKASVDELTTKTLPELLAGAEALVGRFEALLERLNGLSFVLVVPPRKEASNGAGSGPGIPA
jgi:hypothetical protein